MCTINGVPATHFTRPIRMTAIIERTRKGAAKS